jgi:hypothetical protein
MANALRDALVAFIEGEETTSIGSAMPTNLAVDGLRALFDVALMQFTLGATNAKLDSEGFDDMASAFLDRAKKMESEADARSAKSKDPVDAAAELYVRSAARRLEVTICRLAQNSRRWTASVFNAIDSLKSAYDDEYPGDKWEMQAECLTIRTLCEMVESYIPDPKDPRLQKAADEWKWADEHFKSA